MPTIIWKRGDTFKCVNHKVYGIVLDNEGNALIVARETRSEYVINKRVVPTDASPVKIHIMPFEVQMVLNGASIAIGIIDCVMTRPL